MVNITGGGMKLSLSDDQGYIVDEWDISDEFDVSIFMAVASEVEGPTKTLLAAAILKAEDELQETRSS